MDGTGGERPHITAIMNFEQMRTQARGFELEFGGHTTAAEARRILCDCTITPVVLGGHGQPLDVGRTRRTVTPPQRKAVAARDGGCAHPGCDKTPRRCQVHHIIHWIHGGETNITNLVMLCRTHHGEIHESGWKVRMSRGHPEFIPPKWMDPYERPRRNARASVLMN